MGNTEHDSEEFGLYLQSCNLEQCVMKHDSDSQLSYYGARKTKFITKIK